VNDDATVDGSMFEGLARAFEPKGTFADDLRAAGFDPGNPRLRYPSAVLESVLDVIHRHRFPGLGREEAHREAGRTVLSRFFETILGRVLRTLLQALGVERFLLRLPKLAHMGSSGLEIQAERVAPGEIRLVFRGQRLTPDFVAGTLDGAAEATRQHFRVEVTRRGGPAEFELRVTGLR
jgi:uncharacterized protein (TIGR02265 family)